MTDMEGIDPSTTMDESDRAALDIARAKETENQQFIGPLSIAQELAPSREIMAIQDRAQKKRELAEAMTAGSVMRVDPAEVDDLAKFFEDEARGLRARAQDVLALADVQPPGNDPVSTQAAAAYSQVAAGDSQAYMENYDKLIEVFETTAANLRASAQQTRTDDQQAEDSFRGGDLA